MKNPKFVNGQIYHIYNRGSQKRDIFLDDDDYLRFIHNLFEFNDTKPAINTYDVSSYKMMESRKLLVEIMVFCLMPNHFHLLVRQERENGITNFMRKLGTGYTNYFNQKYERIGAVFQGLFKAVLISNESHLIFLPFYIHLNPLGLIEPEWQDRKIKKLNSAIKFLENYRWSSYLDYIGNKNFPSVIQRDFLMEFFRGPEEYKKQTLDWLKEISLEKIRDLTLE